MVDADDLARGPDELMEDGAGVAGAGADVKDPRAWLEVGEEVGCC